VILHSDLIQCATDLVAGKESPLIEMVATERGSETTCDPLLADTREAAAAYLIAAYTDAMKNDDE
jgi:hypothetical protein